MTCSHPDSPCLLPPDFTAHVNSKFDAISKLLTDKDGVYQRLQTLECQCLQSDNSLLHRLEAMETKLALVHSAENVTIQDNPDMERKCNALSMEHDVLRNDVGNVLLSLEQRMESQDSKLLMHTAKHLNLNYKISGINFNYEEDPVQAVIDFFRTTLQFTAAAENIHEAFRTGRALKIRIKGKPVTLPPLMFIKVAPSLKRMIEENKHLLRDQTDPLDGHFYKIKLHIPDAFTGARQHFNPIVQSIIEENENKPDAEKQSFAFRGTDLYIDGSKVIEPIKPPRRSDIVNINRDTANKLMSLDFPALASKTERASRFVSYAIRATDLPLIELAYLKMRTLHPTASHIMLGYVLDPLTEDAKPSTGSCHDGEFQGDVTISRVLNQCNISNIAVFVVRYYGGVPLGGLRLKIIGDLARAAINKLVPPPGLPHQGHTPATSQNTSEHDDAKSDDGADDSAENRWTTKWKRPRFSYRRGRGGTFVPRPPFKSRSEANRFTMTFNTV